MVNIWIALSHACDGLKKYEETTKTQYHIQLLETLSATGTIIATELMEWKNENQ